MNNVQDRLRSLPRKVGVPLEKLLAVGQIDNEIVSKVLDAGELSGDSSKLLGFAAGMVYLRSHHVPVDDVIEMAKRQRRRINLTWSAKRWKEEHDRLSRAETLARLAADDIRYDVAKFSPFLPERFSGYLIRSSRRLGMEGLRQRHCVASYHEQLLAGHCAIASVFLDRKRWTVQLVATGDEDAPLRVVQVKTRYNGVASNEVVKRIHAALNLKPAKESPRPATTEGPRPVSYMENLRAVLPLLRAHGVERVRVTFDGSGDSGSVDHAEYEPRTDTSGIVVPIEKGRSEFSNGAWRYVHGVENVSLDDAIGEIADDYLGDTQVDWYNGDGGFGDLVIDVVEGTVGLDINVRFTESNTAFSEVRDIVTSEEL